MVKCSNGKEDCRSFKVVGAGVPFSGGRYIGKTFGIAAKRAASKIYNKVNNDPEFTKFLSKPSIKFILQETTKGSSKLTKAYEVFKVELDKPTVVTIKNKEVVYKYKYEVKQLKSTSVEEVMNEMV